MYKTVNWKTGPAAMRFRLKNKKNKKPQATSVKRQASSLQDLDPTIDWNKFLKELTK